MARSTSALLTISVPGDGHGFIGELLLPDPQLDVLLPRVPLGHGRARPDLVVGLGEEAVLLGGVGVLVLGLIIPHHN